MKLLILSSAPFIFKDGKCYAYSPYVKELVIWEKYADEIAFCCPVWKKENGLLIDEIPFKFSKHYKLIDFNLSSFSNVIKSIFCSILNTLIIFKSIYQADHIHLRCPGNIGLLGSFVQVFFPNKIKSAKYAGNWDPKSKQPWTYKLQKKILSNTFFTKNIKVMVYGDWEKQSKNIKPMFTATYSESEKETVEKSNIDSGIEFIFVGSLVEGKNPVYAIKLVQKLAESGKNVVLNLYGNGNEKASLEKYIKENKLENFVFLHGNQNGEALKNAYKKSHFVILPSKSEGWPKAIAEGMFWGCVPIATNVSCIPFMLDFGNRGILLEMNMEKDISRILNILEQQNIFDIKSKLSAQWSQKYTTDLFESEIEKILKP
ncbi:glycosyltransferase [uncultured Flavobacterium sp.]|uniref:glycosyltransferase n=1 Tax=uncultured Flavobacterium sp. TaxID=165435 RepID=UPI00292D5CE6|nr:glycosyltransferase [uncultured Flavobacterium sp.]